jgi:photosystem II stability/assembly factor-like uncharacterized protein
VSRGASLVVAGVLVWGLAACGGDGRRDGEGGGGAPTATPTPAGTPTATPSPTPAGIRLAWAVGALGIVPEEGEAGGVILRSDDQGATWLTALTTPRALSGVHFVDETRGWAVGSEGILHTADGGATWQVQRPRVPGDPFVPAETLMDVTFVNAAEGVVVGAEPPPTPFPPVLEGPSLVLRTTNGGRDWEPVSLPMTPASMKAALHFVCFGTGGAGITFGAGVSGDVFLRSRDAGRTWEHVDGVAAGSGACVGGAELWAVGAGPRAFYSPDAGASWQDRSAPLRAVFEGELLAAAFTSSAEGWAVGTETVPHPGGTSVMVPVAVRTTDGGLSWTKGDLVFDPGPDGRRRGPLFAVGARSADVIAVGQDDDLNRLADPGEPATLPLGYYSRDGGITWASSAFPPEAGRITDVAVLP